MRTVTLFLLISAMSLLCNALAGERPNYVLVEDSDGSPLADDQYLRYHYHIPCTEDLRAWYDHWPRLEKPAKGYVIGTFFTIGDISMGLAAPADPTTCHLISGFRVIDFLGVGCVYPEYEGYATVEFDVYCADEIGCPIGPSLWNSGPIETCPGWNYIEISPPISMCGCCINEGPPPTAPRVLLTATHIGTYEWWPRWGIDNISFSVDDGLEMHDLGCHPALYPRPYNSHYSTMHSGYYGPAFEYCPPRWFRDIGDQTPDATFYGYCELAWRLFVECAGPSATAGTTWGTIKSMYR